METKVEIVIPAAPSVEIRRNPREEQLAHVLEITLRDEPEKNEAVFIFLFECLNT